MVGGKEEDEEEEEEEVRVKVDFNCLECGSDLGFIRNNMYLQCKNKKCEACYTIPKIERAILNIKIDVQLRE